MVKTNLKLTFVSLMASAAIAAADPAQAQSAPLINYNIPAEDLGKALTDLARQSNREIYFSADLTRGKRAPAVAGQLSTDQALEQLLAGSGLTYKIGPSGAITIGRGLGESAAGSAAADNESAERQKQIVVTGTNIPGRAPIGAPLQVYRREDIERTGATTTAEFIKTLSQNFNGGITLETNGQFPNPSASGLGNTSDASFSSTVNLRGLGQGTTLILVNGRRVAGAAAQQFGRPYTDISAIPLSAVDRIEVLTDGASAIYGSDAIGGVVNFILKRNYSGAQSRIRLGKRTAGSGGEQLTLSQMFGTGWNTGNVLLSYERYHANRVNVSNVPFINSINAGGFQSGTITPDETTDSLTASATQQLFHSIEAFVDASYANRRTKSDSHSVLTFSGQTDIFDTKAKSRSKSYSIASGFNLALAKHWQAKISASLSKDYYDNNVDLHEVNLVAGIDRTWSPYQARSNETGLITFDALINGTLLNLPAGPVRMALGGQHRDESISFVDNAPGAPAPTKLKDNIVSAVFGELQIPVLKPLGDNRTPLFSADLAARYDKYRSFGSSFNPKFGAVLALSDEFKFRGSYGTSFKPPDPQQLGPYSTDQIVLDFSSDPRLFPIVILSGSNPLLKPETSKSLTFGLDASVSGLNVHLTAYNIRYTNRILNIRTGGIPRNVLFFSPIYSSIAIVRGTIPDSEFNSRVSDILANPNNLRVIFCNAVDAPGRYTPGPLSRFDNPVIFGPCAEPPTNFNSIIYDQILNLADSRDRGIDFSADYEYVTEIGKINAYLSGTYIIDHKQRLTPGSPEVDLVDRIYGPIDLRMRGGLGWERGALRVDLLADYTDSYKNDRVTPAQHVHSFTTFDLNVRYNIGRAFSSQALRGTVVQLHVSRIRR
jgi:outer membrane receptor protein involved in Fe transport